MNELLCLELSIVLWIVHVLTQAVTARAEFGDAYLFSSRDKFLPVKGLVYGRAHRALDNYVENFAPFIAADLALIATNNTGGIGATIWIICRIAYLPCYLFDIQYARTLMWLGGVVGLILMLWRLAGF
jgi:uncharacterized MAPEG superfamily protein